MQHEDIFLAMAQIAVALIGFTGIVAALQKRDRTSWTPLDILRLRTLVEPGLLALFASFLPLILQLIVADPDIMWRVSNGLFFLMTIYAYVFFFLRAARSELSMVQRILVVVSMGPTALLLASAMGMFSGHVFAFALGLWTALGVSAYNFMLLLFGNHQD